MNELSDKTKLLLSLITEKKSANEIANILGISNKQLYNYLTMLKNKGFFFERKFYSIKRVKYELGAKGIDGDIIDKVISDLDPDEEAFLKQAFQKKYFGKIKSSKDFNRAVSYFQRLGYGWNLIKNVLNLFEIEYENN